MHSIVFFSFRLLIITLYDAIYSTALYFSLHFFFCIVLITMYY